jgi:signal transduction histidine kinase
MASSDFIPYTEPPRSAFNYSYVVLSILFLFTIGATLAYYQNALAFQDPTGARWTPVVFLIGVCISLLIFGMTHREATARVALQKKTRDLLRAQQENRALLHAEQQSRIAAERANRAKDEFLAIVSHELNTPLNAIAGWNRILKTEGISQETMATAVEKIDRNLRMQAALIEELLNFSDVMSSGLASINKPVSMRDLFEGAMASVSVAAFQKGVTLVNDNKLEDEQVVCDAKRLKLALVNVLSNAVKFTPEGGNVEARAFRENGTVKCTVTDDGSGIPPEFLPFIFDQYRQSEDPSTRHHGGLGLGLAMAERIVRLHSGKIEAESSGTGKGAKFTISIPIRSAGH